MVLKKHNVCLDGKLLKVFTVTSLGVLSSLSYSPLFAEEICELKNNVENVHVTEGKLTVSGVVKDENGDPIPGASVILKGSTIGTITDIEGKFTLSYSASKKSSELIVSFVGMGSQTVSFKGKKNVVVHLRPEVNSLDEVVVTGYGSSRRKDLTGSVARVGKAELATAPMTNNIKGMLQGRAA